MKEKYLLLLFGFFFGERVVLLHCKEQPLMWDFTSESPYLSKTPLIHHKTDCNCSDSNASTQKIGIAMAVVPEAGTCALGRCAGTAREHQQPLHSTGTTYLLRVNISYTQHTQWGWHCSNRQLSRTKWKLCHPSLQPVYIPAAFP